MFKSLRSRAGSSAIIAGALLLVALGTPISANAASEVTVTDAGPTITCVGGSPEVTVSATVNLSSTALDIGVARNGVIVTSTQLSGGPGNEQYNSDSFTSEPGDFISLWAGNSSNSVFAFTVPTGTCASVKNLSIQPACISDLPGALIDLDVDVPDGKFTDAYVRYEIPSLTPGGDPTRLVVAVGGFNKSSHIHAEPLVVPGDRTFLVTLADFGVKPWDGKQVDQLDVTIPADICGDPTSTPAPSTTSMGTPDTTASATSVPVDADVAQLPPAEGSKLAATGAAIDGQWGLAIGGVGFLSLGGLAAILTVRRMNKAKR